MRVAQLICYTVADYRSRFFLIRTRSCHNFASKLDTVRISAIKRNFGQIVLQPIARLLHSRLKSTLAALDASRPAAARLYGDAIYTGASLSAGSVLNPRLCRA